MDTEPVPTVIVKVRNSGDMAASSSGDAKPNILLFMIPTAAVIVILTVVLAVIWRRMRSDEKSGKSQQVDIEPGNGEVITMQVQEQLQEPPVFSVAELPSEQPTTPLAFEEKSELSFSNLLSSTPTKSSSDPEKQIVHDSFISENAMPEPSRRFSFTLPYEELKAEYADSQMTESRGDQWERVEKVLERLVPVSELTVDGLHVQELQETHDDNEDGPKRIPPECQDVPPNDIQGSMKSQDTAFEGNVLRGSQDINSWSVSRVSIALAVAGLNRDIVKLLKDQGVDGSKLLTLDHSKLEEMGIHSCEARELLLVSVAMMEERNDGSRPPAYF
ncbi:hypothetical protein HDU97_006147 [Phlyctochytrium planicorne]|nr:hypothetical protein HDU97_006147 [Phlyctochytrium planicorne]